MKYRISTNMVGIMMAALFVQTTSMLAQDYNYGNNGQYLNDEQMLQLARRYNQELAAKYNIPSPQKYDVLENYNNIASMYGPKGLYRPSVPGAIAICYGVFLHPNGRVLPDPNYADHTTLENTSLVLRRKYELAKLEYLSVKTYTQQIREASLLESQNR